MRLFWTILRRTLVTLIVAIVVLPLLLSLLLQVPSVQNWLLDAAAEWASDKLGTRVSIGRVDIGLLGKVRVDGFYVEDFQRDTLLYVGRLDAYLTSLGLNGGELTIRHAELDSVKFCLRETPDGVMNVKQVVDRLSNPDKPGEGKFRMKIIQAMLRNSTFSLDKLTPEPEPGKVDFGHLRLDDIKASLDDFAIRGNKIFAGIASLAARDRSGFAIKELSGRFYLYPGSLGFDQARIVTARSLLTLPYISLLGESWDDFKGEAFGAMRVDCALRSSTVATDDIAYFAPALRDWHQTVSDIDLDLSGKVGDLRARIRSLRVADNTRLTANATVFGLPAIKTTRFDINLERFSTTSSEAERIVRSVTGRPLPRRAVSILSQAERLDLRAHFVGSLSSFELRAGATTALGAFDCNLFCKPLPHGRQDVRGEVSTRALKLGELLGKKSLLGDITVTVRVDGVVGRNYADARIASEVSQFGFKGYTYDALHLEGHLLNKEFDGTVTARDPNLDFDFSGLINFNDSVPSYDFTLALRHANLAAMHINRRDSISTLAANVTARGSGRSLDDMNGRIEISDGRYLYNDKELELSSLTVTGENSARSKLIELRSDFADATFRSKTSYHEVFDYLRQSAWKYLPLVYRGNPTTIAASQGVAVADDYSLLSVDIRRFNPIADAVSSGLQIADGSSLQLLFNPANNHLSLRASSEYIERSKLLATRLNINASNRGDSLTFYLSAEDLYAGSLHLPNLSITGGAKQGVMQISTGFTDSLRDLSARMGVRAAIVNEKGPNGRVVDLRILPSHITKGDKSWQIFARRIQLDSAQVVIDRFYVMNSGQELFINGIASRSSQDSVSVRLRNFDLAPFSQFADQMGYAIEGRTNGQATMKAVLSGGEISADIQVDSLAVNGISGPPLRLTSRWDPEYHRAGLWVINRNKADTLVRGFFVPEKVRYFARVKLDSLDMSLLDPVLTGVITDTKGVVSADLTLHGERRNADLSGTIRVAGLQTKVDFTQVTYRIPEAVLDVKKNRLRAVNVPMTDELGNPGRFDFELNMNHLSNITYDVRVAPQKMLVLNTTERNNDVFYGRVFASGMARIKGSKAGVNMDIAATTDDNSSFALPLAGKSTISYANFVTFVEPQKLDTADRLALRKKAFERKRAKTAARTSQMNIALALNVRPNTDLSLSVAGSTIRAKGDGSLNMQINPRTNLFEMYGDYSITEGSFLFSLQNLIKKNFIIVPGSTIMWTGSPMSAMLDLEAVYKVKASLQPLLQPMLQETGTEKANDRSVPVECIIRLTDRLSNPNIAFDVRVPGSDPETQSVVANALTTPESVAKQFVYLLLTSSFLAEANSGASSNLGASVSAGAGVNFLANQLNNLLSNNDYNLNVLFRYRPGSTITSDELDFGVSKSLIDNRLFIELEGNYMLDKKQAVNKSVSNFMGEANVTYLIDRAGALKLRAFTQNIDRFDENQGLQETGIGIYYKEDFNNFRDLRRRIRERFSNQSRKEKRAARKAEERAAKLKERQADTLEAPRRVMIGTTDDK